MPDFMEIWFFCQTATIGWALGTKVWAGSFQRPATAAYTQNQSPGSRKFQIEPSYGALEPISCPWGSGPSGTHPIRSDGPEIENLLWKPHIRSIFRFKEKKVVLSFFRLCLVKTRPFFDNFHQSLFLVIFLHLLTKVLQNSISFPILDHFWF